MCKLYSIKNENKDKPSISCARAKKCSKNKVGTCQRGIGASGKGLLWPNLRQLVHQKNNDGTAIRYMNINP